MFRETDNEYVQTRNWNVLVFMGVVFIMFTILLIRLYSLQYTHYDENLQRSENNRIRKVELIAERGYIYDRNGEVLVRNRPSYQIALQAMNLPRKSSERDSVFQRLLRIKDKNGVLTALYVLPNPVLLFTVISSVITVLLIICWHNII